MTNDFSRWERALAGENIFDLCERGDPATGYYRNPAGQNGNEAIAIWRDEQTGKLQCARNVFGDGSKMDADEIDELFANCGRYPIPHEVFERAMATNQWAPIYTINLRTKDITDGVIWTEAWARKRLAEDVERYDEAGNPRAVIGNNNPPEDLTPDQALAKRIKDVGELVAEYLKKLGGKPTTLEEAEALAAYENKFRDFQNEADAARKAEKEPHFRAGQAVDEKWMGPVINKAKTCKEKIRALIDRFRDEERARREEAARKANEARAEAAKAATRVSGEAAEPVAAVVAQEVKIVGVRGGSRSPKTLVLDYKAFLKHCAEMELTPPDLVVAADKVAKKFYDAGIEVPGMIARESK